MDVRKRRLTQAEIAARKKMVEDWDKPLSPPRPVPKVIKPKRGRPSKEEE